jgi:hypothetical protein
MPDYEITSPDGKKFVVTAPDGATQEQVLAYAQEQFARAPTKEAGILESIDQAIQSNPIGATIAEGAAAVNRGASQVADFLTTTPINAALELAGSESRVPSITETLAPATAGNFMEAGVPRDIVRAAGEVIPSGVAAGSLLRGAAGALNPAMLSSGEGVTAGAVRQLGQTTIGQDAAYTGLSGAGGAVGQEVGGDAGALIGSLAAPLSGAMIPAGVNATKSALATAGERALTKEAAPTIEVLKDNARGVYKEIDNLGAVVNSSRVDGLIRDLGTTVKSEGFNRRIHPKVSAALDEISSAAGTDQKVTDLDTLRKVARSASASIEPDEARLGGIMVGKIDDFMDNLDDSALVGGQSEGVGEKYRHARQLWRRAKKAEDIDFIFDKAKNQASGFENGLRTQFRALLNNKNKIKNYSPEERAAMQKVVRGGGIENTAKALGKFGFTEGQASGMLLGSLGVAGGAAIGGSAGAVAVPLVGQLSKNLAQKLTRNNADFVSELVRSGKDSTAITKAYIRSVPAKDRSAYDLSELLIKSNALGPIKYEPKSDQLKGFMSDVGYLVGAAKSQNQEEQND